MAQRLTGAALMDLGGLVAIEEQNGELRGL